MSKPETLSPSDVALVRALKDLIDSEPSASPASALGATGGPDAAFRAVMAAQEAEIASRPLHRMDRVPCRSDITGAVFTAVIQINNEGTTGAIRWPRGRVVRLEEYVRGADAESKLPSTLTAKQRAHHLFWENDRVDSNRFVGHELPVHVRLDVADRIARLGAELVTSAEVAAPAVARP
jgi:hypothetical protein